MKRSAPYLSDQVLDRNLQTVITNEDTATAIVLDHIAEYDARKLYRAAGYSSMFAYCVGHLRRSEVAAYKRIRVARAARRFPAIFDGIAEGRLRPACGLGAGSRPMHVRERRRTPVRGA